MLKIYNWINGREIVSKKLNWLDKYNPHTGKKMSEFVNSDYSIVYKAVSAAENAFDTWKEITPVNRGQILSEIVLNLKKNTTV
jgi:aldehyde dehydrogenase (NAD+)